MKTIAIPRGQQLAADDAIKLHELARYIYKARKTTMLTGAGISCNAGIPDFRSEDGLYNIVKAKYPTSFIKGQDLFDISLFRSTETLQIFCTFMEGLYKHTLQAKATETHRFIKTLKEKNKLLRCYTQNIDSIEKTLGLNCGLDPARFNELELTRARNFRDTWKDLDVVQLHGNLHQLSCTQCQARFEWTPESRAMLSEGENPECANCHLKYQQRLYSGKRMTGNIGMLRPDIVLYGENHPQSEVLARGLNIDMAMKCDLVLIMGTSLKVDGVKKLVRSLGKNVRERGGRVVFVNKTPVAKQFASLIDYEVLCDCDDFVRALRAEIPDLFLSQEQLDSKKLQGKPAVSQGYAFVKTEGIKLEPSMQEVKHECHGEIQPAKSVLTPPNTPTKKRVQPALRRTQNKNKRAKVKTEQGQGQGQELPSPSASFCEGAKTESDSDVATDCDEYSSPSEDKENSGSYVPGPKRETAVGLRRGAIPA